MKFFSRCVLRVSSVRRARARFVFSAQSYNEAVSAAIERPKHCGRTKATFLLLISRLHVSAMRSRKQAARVQNVCGEFHNTGRKPRKSSPRVGRYIYRRVRRAQYARGEREARKGIGEGAYEFCGKLIHACAYVTVHRVIIQLRESNCGRFECE